MNPAPTILIVDDDPEIRALLARYLVSQGFRVQTAANRRDCEMQVSQSQPDLVVLDVMLPDGSGLDICRGLRTRHPQLPVIMLTALKEDVDRIVGLEIGADDYLGKPFNPRELVARIKAVLRRSAHEPPQLAENRIYLFEGFVAKTELRRIVAPDGQDVDLTGAEFDLFQVFLERPGRLLSRDQLLDLTQGKERDPLDRSIDVLISRLRRKLGEKFEGALFKTVRNGGYQLTARVESRGSDT